MDFKKKIEKLLENELKKKVDLEIPNPEFGDYALPCFKLGENPNEIAKRLANKIKANFIEKIEIKGPYLNFFIKKNELIEDILIEIKRKKNKYGSTNIGKGKKVLIEHTSINPNASPHVGRARNAIIGDSLVRIFKFQGYKTEVHYFVNDVGKQVAMLVLGCKNKKVDFSDLLKIYIKINKEIEDNPEKEREVFELLNKLEKGDKKVKKLFKDVVDICVKGQIKILSKLGIKYDKFDYESKYLWSKKIESILKELEKTGRLFKDDEGRYVLNEEGYDLAMKSAVLVLTRADGTSLYPLRDIAYNLEKLEKVNENIIVLGEDQKLYFQQIKVALDLLDKKTPRVVHYSFVLLSEGKMSTRKGNLVLLEDFMNELIKKAELEIKKRNEKFNKKLIEDIGYGALKYNLLKVSNEKNVIFDWASALSFEGDSGPYVQYAYARACNILKKSKKIRKIDFSLLKNEYEFKLVKKLGDFPNIVLDSLNNLKPNLVTNYTYELAQSFNEFYHHCNVLKSDKKIKDARLFLVDCVKEVLKNGLNLLGIEAPVRM